MHFRDRFINNHILECLSRPQYPYSCGMTALTCVVNYLWAKNFGIIKQESLAEQLGFNAKTFPRNVDPLFPVILTQAL